MNATLPFTGASKLARCPASSVTGSIRATSACGPPQAARSCHDEVVMVLHATTLAPSNSRRHRAVPHNELYGLLELDAIATHNLPTSGSSSLLTTASRRYLPG